ncbi:MAG TPA: hypothetical protein PLP17_09970 [Oligoflexia bacterium]|nr:hypothetical protein [Oligoflexia bacterium]
MEIHSKLEIWAEWKEFLELFLIQNVEFVIVGAVALAAHGEPRWTGDLDVLIRPNEENAARVLNALEIFGFGGIGLTEKDFSTAGFTVQLGREPRRIDILTSISGVSIDEAFASKIEAELLELELPFLGRDELIRNKRATQRERDLRDAAVLERLKD